MSVQSFTVWSSPTIAAESGALRLSSVRKDDVLEEQYEFTIYSASLSLLVKDGLLKRPKSEDNVPDDDRGKDKDDAVVMPESLALKFYSTRIVPSQKEDEGREIILCKASTCALCRLLDAGWKDQGRVSFEVKGVKTSQEEIVSWKFHILKVISKAEAVKPRDDELNEMEDVFIMAMDQYEQRHKEYASEFQEGWLGDLMGLDLHSAEGKEKKLVIPPLEGCLRYHGGCKRIERTPLPNRVINVGTLPDLRARLYEPKEGECAPYVTLSHCWGGEVPDKLLSSNIAEYLEILEVEKLPRTFADAIRLVQRMGYRYLWIDALCIRQDSFDEWEHEAAMMSDIYSNSLFTLSGLDSMNSSAGLYSQFHNDSDEEWVDIADEVKNLSLNAKDTKNQEESRIESAHRLNSRGWTLQERLLTPANLHFLNGQIIWECRTHSLYPSGHFQTSDPFLKRLLPNPSSSRDAFGEVDKSLLWARLVENYSRRNLTKAFDKLIALAGLARTIQRMFAKGQEEDRYYAGLWESDFPLCLLWTKEFHPVNRVREYRAPSWSWASVDGPIAFPISHTTRRSIWHPDDARVIRVGVDEHIPGSLGSVTGGYIDVQGILHRLTYQQEDKCREFFDGWMGSSICYALRMCGVNAFDKTCWLLLEQWGSTYKRVGCIPPERTREPFDEKELERGWRQFVRIV